MKRLLLLITGLLGCSILGFGQYLRCDLPGGGFIDVRADRGMGTPCVYVVPVTIISSSITFGADDLIITKGTCTSCSAASGTLTIWEITATPDAGPCGSRTSFIQFSDDFISTYGCTTESVALVPVELISFKV